MKKNDAKLIKTLVVIFLCIGFIIGVNIFNTTETFKSNDEKIILIDPGHGGMDGGAIAKDGTLEKNINLSISKILKKDLKKGKYKVKMTREKDKGLYSENKKSRIRSKKIEDLNKRCELKKSTNCDMFLSIHLNMFPQSKYHGAQVWYSNNEESKKLAKLLQDNLREDLDKNNNRKEKSAGNSYKILRSNDSIPSVIIECGFLSNVTEREKLKDKEYQKKISKSIVKSINEYFQQ